MIIEVVGKEIEKIKGDFESYLSGLNMVGEISYSQYSELYDEGTKQIQRAYELGKSELEKENAELKTKVTALENANRAMVKELDDTTSGGLSVLENVVRSKDQLTKAKEIIREFLNYNSNSDWLVISKKAEQLLKEVEK